jgi:hypothetical protein
MLLGINNKQLTAGEGNGLEEFKKACNKCDYKLYCSDVFSCQ